ncbi:myocardin-related transcription factor B isoform X3 [Hippoglossus stenolepis]|uniref:myocardin-related transcription factor B isoform X3 n=1 Tax=Hippoglossus stenolepis TaxID=195615 RepID=UPI001FB016C9|nr:myocardin-related transcription factor B isoform X3 [Hippoglossus stenolepis]
MLEQLPCVCIKPAPFRPQPISSSMDERAIRFELERQACQSLRQVLQLKLQQRRTRADLINQGIMPPLKSSAAFHEQRRNLERARTEDYLKRKIRSRPERTELIRMHILEETSAEPSLQVKQLQLKKARLADDLNVKISHRPGPMELIHKNILPVHSIIKQAIETQFPKAAGDNSSCDVDSNDSLSPEQPVGQESPAAVGPPPSPQDTESCIPSPTQDPPSAPRVPLLSGHRPSLKLTNGVTAPSAQRMGVASLIRTKPNSDRSAQRHKKPKDNQPKIKKLKYHQYVPPDQKGEKEPPPLLDSSYAKILQQQQLFLHLQILSQQQQHYNYQAILPAPPKPQKNLSSSSNSRTTSSPPSPLAAPPSVQGRHSSAPLDGTQAGSLPLNLDEMKVVELKCQLKLRSLPVSGTKTGLIERLKAYQELNGGSGTTSAPTAGGNTGPGAEGAGRSSHPAAAVADSASQRQQIQCCRASSLTSQLAAPQQLVTSSGAVSPPPPVSITLSDHPPANSSPVESSGNSDALEEMMRSPLSQSGLQPRSAPRLSTNIKQEFPCSAPAPCQFSLKPASLQKHRPLPSAVPTAPVRTLDKDKMLKEKDQQIEELTRMLRQKQRLVEVLRMQLQHGNRGAQVSEPVVLVRVKQEPPDKPAVTLTSVHPPFPPPTSSVSCDTKVTVKQEAPETEEVQSLDSRGSYLQTQEAQEQVQLHIEPQNKQQHHDCLQQNALQLAQRHVVHKLLLQQQNIHNCNQALENQQKLSLQKKKKSHKQQQKQQILMKQQLKPLFQQQPTKQPQQIQIHTKIHLKQQQVLIQKKQQVQQQAPQVSQEYVKEQSGSVPSLPTWSDSTAALVTDGEGNHFLIALSNRITDAPEGKATNHITLQVENRGPQVSGDRPQQGAAQCVSAPPSLQPLLQNQEAAPSGENIPSPPSHTLGSSLDVLFSRLSPASVQTAASSPDNKPTEHEDDFIDIILQTGEKSTPFNTASDSSLDRLNPNSPASSPASSPFQLMLSPPVAPSCDTPPPSVSERSELQTLVDATGEEQHFNTGSGRLEDFLESTTGKPLLGVEPGGLLTLIDDLHSHMLCTPSILDHPPSPMDTFNMAPEEERGLDSMDWLDLTMGVETGEESTTLAPLGPHTPASIFSTDFLDSCDLQIHWDSCL